MEIATEVWLGLITAGGGVMAAAITGFFAWMNKRLDTLIKSNEVTQAQNEQLKQKAEETAKDAKIARQQVANSHDTNLREEADERHAELKRILNGAVSDIKALNRRLSATDKKYVDVKRDHQGLVQEFQLMRQDIGILKGKDRDLAEDISDLENTFQKHVDPGPANPDKQ